MNAIIDNESPKDPICKRCFAEGYLRGLRAAHGLTPEQLENEEKQHLLTMQEEKRK